MSLSSALTWSILTVSLIFSCLSSSAAVRYVNPASIAPMPPFTNWLTAAVLIQDAIDVATAGDEIVVTNGVYQTGGRAVYDGFTNRVAVTKAVTVRSVNGPEYTIIRGAKVPSTIVGTNAIRGVYLTNGAMLTGFTVTDGAASKWDAYSFQEHGGGIWCESTGTVISNCVVAGNTAEGDAGGVYRGSLLNCALQFNTGLRGGGAAFSVLNDCVLLSNTVSVYGGGVAVCVMTNCILTGNSNSNFGGAVAFGSSYRCMLGNNAAAYGGGAYNALLTQCTISGNEARIEGGGVYASTLINSLVRGNLASRGGGASQNSILLNCAISGNWGTNSGGGVFQCALTNCTLTRNSAPMAGGALFSTLQNCILYYNQAASPTENYSGGSLDYCVTTPLPLNGNGNKSLAPRLVSDAHISADSPCRGAGNPQIATGLDIDGENWANPPSIGCDEYGVGAISGPLIATPHADLTNVATAFAVNVTAAIDGHARAVVWNFGDGVVVSNETHVSHEWASPGLYQVSLTAFNDSYPTGVATSVTVHVSNEVHYVSLASSQPTPPFLSWTTAATSIQQAVDVAVLPGALILVSNGVYQSGSRIVGSTKTRLAITRPVTVQSINGPEATHIVGSTFEFDRIRCVYLTNRARIVGLTLTNGSTTSSDGGGGARCESFSTSVRNCVIVSNASHFTPGGGSHGGTLENCVIKNNISGVGAGAYNSTLINCILTGNAASDFGGGAYRSDLFNCSVVTNSAGSSGGGVGSSTARNSIIYHNTAPLDPNVNLSVLDYSCTTPLPTNGTGNISDGPLFQNAFGNLRLQSSSPCVDAGSTSYAPRGVDLDGNRRIAGVTVDLGAYEFIPDSLVSFIAWLQQNGLNTDGSADFTDGDGDGMNNYQEYAAGTMPTNAESVLRMLPPEAGASGVSLSWKSVPNRIYVLEWAAGFVTQPVFSILQSNLTGQVDKTSFVDTNALERTSSLYRIRLHQ